MRGTVVDRHVVLARLAEFGDGAGLDAARDEETLDLSLLSASSTGLRP